MGTPLLHCTARNMATLIKIPIFLLTTFLHISLYAGMVWLALTMWDHFFPGVLTGWAAVLFGIVALMMCLWLVHVSYNISELTFSKMFDAVMEWIVMRQQAVTASVSVPHLDTVPILCLRFRVDEAVGHLRVLQKALEIFPWLSNVLGRLAEIAYACFSILFALGILLGIMLVIFDFRIPIYDLLSGVSWFVMIISVWLFLAILLFRCVISLVLEPPSRGV